MKVGIIASKEFFVIPEVIGDKKEVLYPFCQSENNTRSQPNISFWKQDETRHFNIHAVHCGIGEIAAAAATQALIDRVEVDFILNFGMAHSLRPNIERTVHIVRDVIHYDFDVTECNANVARGEYPQLSSCHNVLTGQLMDKLLTQLPKPLPIATCASGDTFVVSNSSKTQLREEFGADICDMNAAGVLLTCQDNDIPCVILKGITDGVHNGAYSYDFTFDNDVRASFAQVLPILEFLATH